MTINMLEKVKLDIKDHKHNQTLPHQYKHNCNQSPQLFNSNIPSQRNLTTQKQIHCT